MRFLFFFFLIIFGGCAPPEKPLPRLTLPADEIIETLLQKIQENELKFQAFAGMAKIKITLPERTIAANQVLFIEEPNHFRADILSPFGTPVLTAAANGERFDAYIPGEGIFYRGAANLENIQKFIPIPLRLDDLVDILLYHPPLITFETAAVNVQKDGYLLSLENPQRVRQLLRFDSRLRLKEAAYYRDENLQMQIHYDKFDEGTFEFPLSAQVEMPVYETQASVSLNDIEINPTIPASRFTLSPPEGVAIQPFPQN